MFARELTGQTVIGAILAIGCCTFALAWQTPDDFPQAPRVGDAPPAPAVILNDQESGLASPTPSPPRSPAPAIVPVEEIIAQPAAVEPTVPPIPDTSPAIGSGVVVPESADDSANDEKATPATTVKATIFKGAVPGETTVEQLAELWGKPRSEQSNETVQTLTFEVKPFSRIEAHVAKGIVNTIVIHLNEVGELKETKKILDLSQFRPAHLHDAQGKLVGLTFPERGVSLIFAGDGAESNKIARVQLQPITAEAFLLRVHGDGEFHWEQNLVDLGFAAKLAPNDERVYWLQSEILTEQSEYHAAALAIEKALAVRPESALYHLSAANLIAHAGNYEDAIAATDAVVKRESIAPLVKARAAVQLGDLLADSPRHDYAEALRMHQLAIQTALPLASSPQRGIRRAAKQLLIDAHTAIATDIAQGNWKKKSEAVPQWMDRADAIVAEYVENDQASQKVRFDVICSRLETYAWLDGAADPAIHVSQLNDLVTQLRGESDDPTYRRHLDWKYAKAMIDAVDIERARGNSLKANEYGKLADEKLSPLADANWNAERVQFQFNRMYFLLGSIQAVQLEDHQAAVQLFDKALAEVSRPEPDKDLAMCVRRGQWLVSMGVSYWHADRKDEALKLTNLGVRLIEAAIEGKVIEGDALAAPYNNLAFMHENLGNQEDAKRFSEMATKVNENVQR